jgi:hypothetical protein
MKLDYTREDLEQWRDRVHRRTVRRAVRNKVQAIRFIDDVGFCFAFSSAESELPSLWHAMRGERSSSIPAPVPGDSTMTFIREMKHLLPAEGKAFYGRMFRHRPSLVSMEYFPYFMVLADRSGHQDDYLQAFRRGNISPCAMEIMDVLRRSSPKDTHSLRKAVGASSRSRSHEFEKAMLELQTRFYIARVSGPANRFVCEWNTVNRAFPAASRRAHRIQPIQARTQILHRYFQNQLIGSVHSIRSVFGWKRAAIFETIGQLMNDGVIMSGVTLDGKDGRYYCLVN